MLNGWLLRNWKHHLGLLLLLRNHLRLLEADLQGCLVTVELHFIEGHFGNEGIDNIFEDDEGNAGLLLYSNARDNAIDGKDLY